MHTIALTTREHTSFLLLVVAAKVEAGNVSARVHTAFTELDEFVTAADDFPNGLFWVDLCVLLVDITDFHCLAHFESARIRLFQTHDEAE